MRCQTVDKPVYFDVSQKIHGFINSLRPLQTQWSCYFCKHKSLLRLCFMYRRCASYLPQADASYGAAVLHNHNGWCFTDDYGRLRTLNTLSVALYQTSLTSRTSQTSQTSQTGQTGQTKSDQLRQVRFTQLILAPGLQKTSLNTLSLVLNQTSWTKSETRSDLSGSACHGKVITDTNGH